MKQYDSGQKRALLAMVVFVVLAVVFFALFVAFHSSAGEIFTALWLFSVTCVVIAGADLLIVTANKGKRKRRNESKR